MRRRHREIAGGEVAMMAVITKAMGAFLVLMILLLPYYTGDTQGQQTVEDTQQHLDEAKNGLDGAVDRLKKGRLSDAEIDDLLKRLAQARDELVAAQGLIAQLKIKIDQAASQINRLEQQNTDLQAQIATLQKQVASLQAEIEALKQETARLRAVDTEALQVRIRELEEQVEALKAQVAQIVPLQNKIASQKDEIEKLMDENETMRTLAAFPTIYLSSKCDLPAMVVDLYENPIGVQNFKAIDKLIPEIMPWDGKYTLDQNSTSWIDKGDTGGNSVTNVTLSFEESQEYQYDFFIRLFYFEKARAVGSPQEQTDGFYSLANAEGPKNAAGDIVSSKSHPSCNVTMFINWHGDFEPVGVFKVGPVEPVVHVKRVSFSKDNKISYPREDRRDIEQQIANQTCTRYPAFCALATQHAKLRARGSNPWDYEKLDDTLFAPVQVPQKPKPDVIPVPPKATPTDPKSVNTAPPGPADQPSPTAPPPPPAYDRTIAPK